MLAVCLIPIPTKAQEVYEGGVAIIDKSIPLNRHNATTKTPLSEDNDRFVSKTGFNVSDFYARNINYQNRETYFNDSLYNMATTTIRTQAGDFMGFLPQLNASGFSTRPIELVSDKMDITEQIQAVGKKYSTDFIGGQVIQLNLDNLSIFCGFADASLISMSGDIVVGFGENFGDGFNFVYDFNASEFDWVMDFTCNRFGITITVGEYWKFFETQNYTNIYNTTLSNYPQFVYANEDFTMFRCFVDLVDNKQLYTYKNISLSEIGMKGGNQINPLGIEGLDSRLIGYYINNTLYPDNTFYPNRFDQIYQLFYEPYQNFENAIISFDYISNPDYISMAYEYIGNRWISGENGEIFFPTDEVAHFFTDYSNVKRHILLSGNLLLLLGSGVLEYFAPFTFQDGEFPSEWWKSGDYFTIIDDYGAHFHALKSTSVASAGFQTEQNLTSWNLELYFAIPNGESLNISLTDIYNLTDTLDLVINDTSSYMFYNHIQVDSEKFIDYCDSGWHRLVLTTDLFSLFQLYIDGNAEASGTIAGFNPSEMRNITFFFSGSNIYLDGIGVVGDRDYTANENLYSSNSSLYTANFENTIFDKRTSGLSFTWRSDHNRFNMSTEYFNFKITFQILIEHIRIFVNGSDEWSYKVYEGQPPYEVLRNSYLKRAINYELWIYPYFDGSNYRLALDFTFEHNRTVIYPNWLTPLDFSLSNQIKTRFNMNDVDLAKAIVFTSTIKSLLKTPESLTKGLTFVNRHYLSRKLLYYRFSDVFNFNENDMKIYVSDGVFTREISTAKTIIPLNLTAGQRIIQTNTTQYNNAECITKIDIFNKTTQLYSENGYNVSKSINDTTLNELPVYTMILQDGNGQKTIPLSSEWWDTVGNAISTLAVITHQAAVNPIGAILSFASIITGNNYQPTPPIYPNPNPPSGHTLPIVGGATIVGNLIDVVQTTILTPSGHDNNGGGNPKTACQKLAEMIAALSTQFFGVILAKKIWEIIQLDKAYELCNMMESAWNYITSGVNPTTIGNIKLSVSIKIHGIFSFSEQVQKESWLSFVIQYLIPFLLPIIFGYVGKQFHPKLVPLGIVLGFIADGISGIIGWDYAIVFSILGALGSYFLMNRPTFNFDNGGIYSDESREKTTISGDDYHE